MPRFEAVLFDLWDTLVPSTKDREVERIREELQLPKLAAGRYVDHQRLEWFPTATPAEKWFEHFLESEEVVPNQPRLAACVRAWESARAAARPFPEALEVLRELRLRGLRLGLVSNTEVGTREAVVERLGLHKLFDSIVLSYEELAVKPDPRPFVRCLGQLRVSPPAALFAGDRMEVDVIPARRLGMQGVLVDRAAKKGYKPRHALAVVKDLRGLLPLL
jgi:HAD superfamily hydrolase (TIGR01549 family)